MAYWLVKTEPETFSIDDLERVQVEPWSGVRSTFARAHMRKMNVGDDVLIYHSNADPSGVVGLAKVERTKVIDETQFDPASPYFDEKATREKPIWDCVDVRFAGKLPYMVSLPRIRRDELLADMVLLRIGRLSVQPVTELEFRHIVELGQLEPPPEPPKPKQPRHPAKKKPNKKPPAKKQPAKRKRTKRPARIERPAQIERRA